MLQPGDMLQRIASLLRDEDGGGPRVLPLGVPQLPRALGAATAQATHGILRSRARVAYAWSHPGFQLESRAMWRLAVGVGSVDVLDWLRSQLTGALDATICTAAARAGQLSALQWLGEQHCQWKSSTCSAAAEKGHLEVLQWAREHGCEWNSSTCSEAAGGGHLEVLQWVREHGCEWSYAASAFAARGGHLECCNGPGSTAAHGWHQWYCLAVAGGHQDLVAWINAAPA